MKSIRRFGLAAVIVVLASGAVAACDDDDDDAQSDDTTEETTGTDEAPVVEVELADFEFVGLPDTVPVGTKLTVTNTSEAELHEIVVLRLPDGEDRPLDELVELPDEEFDALLQEMPAMVLLAEPAGPQIDAVGDGTLSRPGRYIVLCAIPTGVDPAEYFAAAEVAGEGPPDVEGAGPPHFVHGMYAEITVE